jgi:hypothetical protein
MIYLVRRWPLPAALGTVALALGACAGSGGSPVPLTPDQISPAGFRVSRVQLHLMSISEGVPDVRCPKRYLFGCDSVSVKTGFVAYWCEGTPTGGPCATTEKYKWTGNVCRATSKTCSLVEQMTAAWTGPFPCKSNPYRCAGTKKGYYEVDTISIGKAPPKQNKRYRWKQQILLSGSLLTEIGLDVCIKLPLVGRCAVVGVR